MCWLKCCVKHNELIKFSLDAKDFLIKSVYACKSNYIFFFAIMIILDYSGIVESHVRC